MAVSSIDSTGAYAFLNSNSKTKEEKNSGSLAMEDFMSLMTTQLKNQDPLKPMENGDFLSQIASFGTVSGIEDLQKSFSGFTDSMTSNQVLQGASLVGRSVLVASSIGIVNEESDLKGQINVADPVKDLKVKIYNEDGVVVRTMQMGAAEGYTNFSWDGTNDDGEKLDSGVYQFKASGTIDGENTAFATAVVAKVESVLTGSGGQGLTLNLGGIGSVSFKDALEIT